MHHNKMICVHVTLSGVLLVFSIVLIDEMDIACWITLSSLTEMKREADKTISKWQEMKVLEWSIHLTHRQPLEWLHKRKQQCRKLAFCFAAFAYRCSAFVTQWNNRNSIKLLMWILTPLLLLFFFMLIEVGFSPLLGFVPLCTCCPRAHERASPSQQVLTRLRVKCRDSSLFRCTAEGHCESSVYQQFR